MHDSAAGAALATAQIPEVTVQVWPKASHSLPMEHPTLVDRELLGFWAAHDG